MHEGSKIRGTRTMVQDHKGRAAVGPGRVASPVP